MREVCTFYMMCENRSLTACIKKTFVIWHSMDIWLFKWKGIPEIVVISITKAPLGSVVPNSLSWTEIMRVFYYIYEVQRSKIEVQNLA